MPDFVNKFTAGDSQTAEDADEVVERVVTETKVRTEKNADAQKEECSDEE